jgi:hypothetical protein
MLDRHNQLERALAKFSTKVAPKKEQRRARAHRKSHRTDYSVPLSFGGSFAHRFVSRHYCSDTLEIIFSRRVGHSGLLVFRI